MNKRDRKESGITLVALVITIIVLLILAGVSIALVVGDNGVLSKAKDAKTGSIVAEEKEQVDLAYSSALTKNLGAAVTAENLQDELDESVGSGKTTVSEDGNNLNVLFNETGHNYVVNRTGRTGDSNNSNMAGAGLQSDGSFIGLKSTGKYTTGETDNYWNDEYRGMTLITINGEDGYKFTAGHFVHITDYNGVLWDETENDFVSKTGADVYLCWNADYGTITSEQDLIDYDNAHGKNVTYWDIFDASSGAWLSSYMGRTWLGE